jgi:hypothetical protein
MSYCLRGWVGPRAGLDLEATCGCNGCNGCQSDTIRIGTDVTSGNVLPHYSLRHAD